MKETKIMNQEIEQLTILLKNLIEKIQKPSRFDELTEEIKKIEELKHLFDDDYEKEYSHLQKCVMMPSKFKILEEYIDLYLAVHPETIDNQTDGGETALMMAARALNYESKVEILLKHGAKVNLQNTFGSTALIYALYYFNCNEKSVELLLRYGADLEIKDDSDHTALYYAVNFTKNEKIIEMIMNKMENCDIKLGEEKLIKYLFDQNASDKIISLAIQKGAKISDICEERIINLIKSYA